MRGSYCLEMSEVETKQKIFAAHYLNFLFAIIYVTWSIAITAHDLSKKVFLMYEPIPEDKKQKW